jgi:hypothetical protein
MEKDHNLVNQFGKEINNASTLYNTSQRGTGSSDMDAGK